MTMSKEFLEPVQKKTTDRLIRLKELKTIVGISGTSIWRRCKEGSFPAAVRIGPNAVAWKLSQVEEWMDSRQGA
jgi:prophage regulatory protein